MKIFWLRFKREKEKDVKKERKGENGRREKIRKRKRKRDREKKRIKQGKERLSSEISRREYNKDQKYYLINITIEEA